MPVLLGAQPDKGFDDPIGLLSDCHRRIERFLGVLIAVSDRSRGRPIGTEERNALATALRYFREAAPRHTQDEEESLFPRMRSATGAGAAAARTALRQVEELERQHADAAAWHHEVDVLGERWLSHGTLDATETDRLRDLLAVLRRLYQEHIAVEDREVFPAAAKALTKADLEAMGQEMARRRGLEYKPAEHDEKRC